MSEHDQRDLIDAATAEKLSGLKRQTLYKLAAAGKLASYRVLNRSVRFAKEDVLALAIPRSVRRSDRGMRQ